MNFEEVYDELMDQTIYEQWTNFASSYLNQDEGPILDLACGSGRLSLKLKLASFDIVGLDYSSNMLIQAQKRAEKAGMDIQWVLADMRDLSAFRQLNGVVCSLDALCYLPYPEDLLTVFEEVHSSLGPAGYFLFDVHSPKKIQNFRDNFYYNYSSEEWAFLWECWPADEDYAVIHQLDLFNKAQAGSYKRQSRDIYQRTYSLEQYLKLLKHVGFNEIDIWGGFSSQADLQNADRWLFACQKTQDEGA